MSYILEALKKSDAERKRGTVPTIEGSPAHAATQAERSRTVLPWVVAGTLGVAVVSLAGLVFLRPSIFIAEAPTSQSMAETPPPVVMMASPAIMPEPESGPESKPESGPEPKPEFGAKPEPAPVTEAAVEAAIAPVVETPTKPEPMAKAPPKPQPQTTPKPERPPITIHRPTPKVAQDTPPVVVETTAKTTTPVPEPVMMPRKPSVIMAPKTTPAPEPKANPLADAKTFVDQAWSSIDKGLYNQALRELNQAVEIEPNLADAWFARGWANEKSGKELSAIGDYARAIAAKPDHAFALFSRGYLNLYVGNPQSAVTDFVRTQGVTQDHSLRLYSHLWLYLSRLRSDQDALARLSEDAAHEDLTAWPGPLVSHFLGQTEEGRVLAAIENGEAEDSVERRCTGYFFLGISALNKGDKKRARSYFEKTLATGAVQFRQYDAAQRELDRLNL